MTPATPDGSDMLPAPRRRMSFRKQTRAVPPTPEQSRRQSHVVQSAWRHFGEPGSAIAFLNTRHAALQGQPLQLAIESDRGLARVDTLLTQMTAEARPKARTCE